MKRLKKEITRWISEKADGIYLAFNFLARVMPSAANDVSELSELVKKVHEQLTDLLRSIHVVSDQNQGDNSCCHSYSGFYIRKKIFCFHFCAPPFLYCACIIADPHV